MKATIHVQMFNLPNYMKIDGPIGDSNGLDVGFLFPTDQDAAQFWEECTTKWVAHVAKRRAALGKSEGESL